MPQTPTLDFEKNPGFLRPGETADQYSARNTGLGNASITSDALTPATPMNIPPTPIATDAAGLEGSLSEFAKQYQAQADEAQKAKEQSGRDFASSLFSTQGEASLTNDLYSRPGGVDETQRELQEINQQLLQEQEGFRREVETIQDNAEGLTRGGVAGRVDEARRKSLRTQADLSVIQLAKQGRYDSAKAIADRAINVQLEKDKQRNEILKFIYEENRDLFNSKEQRAFEVAQTERERDFNTKAAELKMKSDLSLDALQNGAPSSIAAQMRAAETVEEAMRIGGQYVGAIQRAQAYATMQSANLARRVNLLALAEKGDKKAIQELGFDPNDLPLTAEELMNNESTFQTLDEDIKKLNGALGNTSGLRASSGLFRGSLTPITASNKQNFLADTQYIIKNLTFDKLAALKKEGVNLTPISEKELRAMADASSVLAAGARYDDAGNLTGFKIPEQRVYELIKEVQSHMTQAQQELNINAGLSKSDKNSVIELFSQ